MTFNQVAPRVAGIGSCRICTPLMHIERGGSIKIGHNDAAWYTHTTKDILQKLSIVTGEGGLPVEHVPLIVDGLHKYRPDKHRPDIFANVRCFVVEVSSIKTHSYRGLEVHQWCLRDMLIREGVSLNLASRALQFQPAERDLSFLGPQVSPLLRSVLKELRTARQNSQEILRDLRLIADRLQQTLVLVPPFNIPGNDGELLPERVLLAETLEQFCKESGAIFFNPAQHIMSLGAKNAVIDLGHYSEQGEKLIAGKLFDAIKTALCVVS